MQRLGTKNLCLSTESSFLTTKTSQNWLGDFGRLFSWHRATFCQNHLVTLSPVWFSNFTAHKITYFIVWSNTYNVTEFSLSDNIFWQENRLSTVSFGLTFWLFVWSRHQNTWQNFLPLKTKTKVKWNFKKWTTIRKVDKMQRALASQPRGFEVGTQPLSGHQCSK